MMAEIVKFFFELLAVGMIGIFVALVVTGIVLVLDEIGVLS